MRNLGNDLKLTLRQLAKSPGFTLAAVLMLAFGIGATTAIFSIVEGVLLRPLPFPDPDRLMFISDVLHGAQIGDTGEAGVTAPDIHNYSHDNHTFTSLGGYQSATYELTGTGDPAMIDGQRMSSGVFPALQVQPLLGRFFTQQEDEGRQPVTVLSYSGWQKRFHGDPNILGKKILLDRKPYVVIGVMPRNFEFPLEPGHLSRVELWVPTSFVQEDFTNGASGWNFNMIGRLKPGVTHAEALADLSRIATETIRNYPAYMSGFSMHPIFRPLHEETVRDARPLIHTLLFAVVVVLLIACANLAGLLLVRSIRRRREIAVRLALGATASTLLRQSLLESLTLSISGGILGLILAAVALRTGISFLPETLPRINEIKLDWHVIAFALAIAILTGIVCGLAPAFAAIRTSVNETLKEGGRTGSIGGVHARLRSALVVAEIAVALILLTASGLLLRSFEKMRKVDLGYRPDHTLVASYGLPLKQYPNQAAVDTFNHELERRLAALPGVHSAGITSFLPATGDNTNSGFVAEGYVPPNPNEINLATAVRVEGDYFGAMGISLLRGRFFTPSDKAGVQPVIIVNRKLAERSWPGQNPIGKRLRLGTSSMKTPWAVVVGEVADIEEQSPDLPTKQQYYIPVDQWESMAGELAAPDDINGNGGFIALRTSIPPEQIANTLRATVRSLDPQLPLSRVQTMEHALSETEAPRRFNTILISGFAATAILLAILGIYSVIAFSVAQRGQEMAIRMALGSQRSGIVRLVVLSATKLAAIGCILGLGGAIAASSLLRSFLFHVSATDPLVLAGAAIALLLLAAAAALLPARRAAATNLTEALRAE